MRASNRDRVQQLETFACGRDLELGAIADLGVGKTRVLSAPKRSRPRRLSLEVVEYVEPEADFDG